MLVIMSIRRSATLMLTRSAPGESRTRGDRYRRWRSDWRRSRPGAQPAERAGVGAVSGGSPWWARRCRETERVVQCLRGRGYKVLN